jgi:hypothetical protein
MHRCTAPDVAGRGVEKGGSLGDRLAVGGMWGGEGIFKDGGV